MPDIRYNGKFGSADSNVYQCQLWDSAFTGSAEDFPLESVTFIRGRRGMHNFAPIRASSVELKGYKLTQTALDELLGASVGRFTLELKRAADHATIDGGGGSLYWKGIVQTDLGEDDTARQISDIKITATDGLALLRDVRFTDTTGESEVNYEGRENHRLTIIKILSKIGYNLPTAFAADWYPDVGSASDVLWENAEVDQSVFYDDDGAPANCYDVLKAILYPYGGVMFWRDGRFVFCQKSQLDGGSFTANAYDENGVADGTISLGAVVDTDGEGVVLVEGSRVYEPAFGSNNIIYAHGNVPSLIPNGDFEEDPGGWVFGSNGGEIRISGGELLQGPRGNIGRGGVNNSARINRFNVGFVPAYFFGEDETFAAFRASIAASGRYIEMTGSQVEAGDFLALTGRFRIPYNSGGGGGLYNTFFEMQIGSNADAYCDRFGNWFTPSGDESLISLVSEGENYNTFGFALSRGVSDGWYDFTIVTAAAPYTGDVRLKLFGTADENSSNLDPEGVEWSDINVFIVDNTGEIRDSIQFSGVTTSPEPGDDDLTVLIGQGPHPLVAGNVTWNGSDAVNWTDGTNTEKLTQLLVRHRLARQNGRLENRFETYKGLGFEMGDVVQIGGNTYDVLFQSKDLASQYDTIETIRVLYDDSDITFAEVATDQGTYTLGGGGSSTSVITNPSDGLGQLVTAKGDLIAGGEGGSPETLSSGETDGLALVTDSSAAQGWSLQALTPITTKGDVILGNATGEPSRLASGETDGLALVTDSSAAQGWSLQALTPITTKGDLIVGNATGEPARLPVPADDSFYVADSNEPFGWRAYSINNFTLKGEIPGEYVPSADARRWKFSADSVGLSGTGVKKTHLPWVITANELPSGMLDTGADSLASGAPTLRASLDPDGILQIPLKIVDCTPHATTPSAEILFQPGTYTGGSDRDIYFWWIVGGSQTQPGSGEDFGAHACYDETVVLALNDDISGGTIADSTQYGNDGTVTGAVSGSTVAVPGSLASMEFDGVNDRIVMPDADSLDATKMNMIYSFYPRDLTNAGWQQITSKREGLGTNYGCGFNPNSGGADVYTVAYFYWSGFRVINIDLSDNFTVNTWHNCISRMEQNGSIVEADFYLGGSKVVDAQSFGTHTMPTNSAELTIGATQTSANTWLEHFDGFIDYFYLCTDEIDDDQAAMINASLNPSTFFNTGESIESGPF